MITDFLSATEIAFILLFVVPTIYGLVNMIKDLGVPTRVVPLVSLALGIVLMVLYANFRENPIFTMIMVGTLVGLAPCGYYDLAKIFKRDEVVYSYDAAFEDLSSGEETL